jgi:hypothetical protein
MEADDDGNDTCEEDGGVERKGGGNERVVFVFGHVNVRERGRLHRG